MLLVLCHSVSHWILLHSVVFVCVFFASQNSVHIQWALTNYNNGGDGANTIKTSCVPSISCKRLLLAIFTEHWTRDTHQQWILANKTWIKLKKKKQNEEERELEGKKWFCRESSHIMIDIPLVLSWWNLSVQRLIESITCGCKFSIPCVFTCLFCTQSFFSLRTHTLYLSHSLNTPFSLASLARSL